MRLVREEPIRTSWGRELVIIAELIIEVNLEWIKNTVFSILSGNKINKGFLE